MSQNSSDPRVLRTCQAFQEALIDLINSQHSFEAITVRDLAKHAGLNRATFYLHYTDKYDLFAQTMRGKLEEVASEIDDLIAEQKPEPADIVLNILLKVFEHTERDKRLYEHILGKNGSPYFANLMLRYLENLFEERHMERKTLQAANVPSRIHNRYKAAALLGVVSWWLEQPKPNSTRDMAVWTWQLMMGDGSKPATGEG